MAVPIPLNECYTIARVLMGSRVLLEVIDKPEGGYTCSLTPQEVGRAEVSACGDTPEEAFREVVALLRAVEGSTASPSVQPAHG